MLTEDRLIRCFLKANINPEVSCKIKEMLTADLDWDYFLERAKHEGVTSLAYKRLSEFDSWQSHIPQATWRRMEWNIR